MDIFFISSNASITVKCPGISSEPCLKYPVFTLCPRRTDPDKAGVSPRIVLSNVVLPIPLFPIIAVVLPRCISVLGIEKSSIVGSFLKPTFRLCVLRTISPVRLAFEDLICTVSSLEGACIFSILANFLALPLASLDLCPA